ncbi:uncharacterized protein LOC131167867 [Malania oleifera]|uniref:uncharacterized protein LOC131167867 n=1 Tax=Malania oleifera TaxID=397392 RepID=UPI0025ADDCA1|nr:uncharacterized protein LOC131167867 [Malania oleifera]
MQVVHLLEGRSSVEGGGRIWSPHWRRGRRSYHRRRCVPAVVVASAALNQNHYAVLGLSPTASRADIKRAYRLLARKCHPDVSKNSQADELFKSIRLAYDVLSNDTTRTQYDRALRYQEDSGRSLEVKWKYDAEFGADIRVYRRADLKQKMWHERYWEQVNDTEDNSYFHRKTDDMSEEETLDEERGPFSEVLRKLDAGYKMDYLIAWVLGGRGGILLALCLSFASWACGKTSSSTVALVVVAMWVVSNLARYAPLPQGALLTLLYMSIKLQVDLK